jgi:hypothetical protein
VREEIALGQFDEAGSKQRRRKKRAPSCDDCFFRGHALCALDLDAPCSTFRPDTEQGLVPPRQPALLLRDPGTGGVELDDGLAQTA